MQPASSFGLFALLHLLIQPALQSTGAATMLLSSPPSVSQNGIMHAILSSFGGRESLAVEDSRDDSAPALSTETLEQNRCVLFLSIASDSRIPGDFLFLKQRDEMRIKSIPITPMSWDVFKAAPKKALESAQCIVFSAAGRTYTFTRVAAYT
jgi:hypothetical protein